MAATADSAFRDQAVDAWMHVTSGNSRANAPRDTRHRYFVVEVVEVSSEPVRMSNSKLHKPRKRWSERWNRQIPAAESIPSALHGFVLIRSWFT